VLILNKAKAPGRKGHVLFINGAKEFEERPKKNVLGEANITRLVETFRAWTDEDRFCRVVELSEIEENDFNLNISRYIDTLEPEQPIDVKTELQKLWAAEKARDEAAARMNALLAELGYAG
jgi:type I restriction enzyme M protein